MYRVPKADRPEGAFSLFIEDAVLLESEQGRVIDLLYRAAGSETPWAKALDGLSEYCGGRTGVIYRADAQLGLRYPLALHRINADLPRRYNHEYRAIDPWRLALLRSDADRVHNIDQIIDHRELCTNRYFIEKLDPAGIHHGLTVRMDVGDREYLVITLHRNRDDGPVDAEHVGRLSALLPHVSRAAALHHHFTVAGQAHQMAQATLEGLAPAIFVLDRAGRPTFMNTTAREIVSARNVLCLADGCLTARSSNHATRVASLLQRVVDADGPVAPGGLILERTSGQPPLRVLAVALRGDHGPLPQPWNDVAEAAVLVVASDCTIGAVSVPDHLRMQYRLTPTEVRVLEQFVQCGDPAKVARRLGVRISTVRSHLKALLAKCGMRRQSELLGLFIRSLFHEPRAEALARSVERRAVSAGVQTHRDPRWWTRP